MHYESNNRDYQGRRIEKIVSAWDSQSWSWVPSYTNRFVYDGWNLIAVLNPDLSPLLSFSWGTDLSGTIQGAGLSAIASATADGVGGLISVTVHSGANAGTYFCSYDGNGNVSALVKASDGSVAARYEYGPFGEVIRATGSMAKVNPFRFSTKYQDDETDLLYYGYRYYNASTGRWLSRDPVVEVGFRALIYPPQWAATDVAAPTPQELLPVDVLNRPDQRNSYLFVSNDPGDQFDAFGLWQLSCRWLSGVVGATRQKRCHIECGGHSYSLLNNNGTAVKVIDDSRDRGQGDLIASGPGRCNCIKNQFNLNKDSYPYSKGDCNSNYYAHNILKCCGIIAPRPPRAYGWDSCTDQERMVSCACWPGLD